MTTVTLQERLEEATEDLSRCQVASDVAEILRVEGVQGKRGNCQACPVASLLMLRLGPYVAVSAGELTLDAWDPSIGDSSLAEVPTPAAVGAFMAEFDGYSHYEAGRDQFVFSHGGWDEFAVASP